MKVRTRNSWATGASDLGTVGDMDVTWLLLFAAGLGVGVAVGYWLRSRRRPSEPPAVEEPQSQDARWRSRSSCGGPDVTD